MWNALSSYFYSPYRPSKGNPSALDNSYVQDSTYHSAALNGSTIQDLLCSINFDEKDELESFYVITEGHGQVFFRIQEDQALVCHLVGTPGALVVKIERAALWAPGQHLVHTPRLPIICRDLKIVVKELMMDWTYQLGERDCRDFSYALALKLAMIYM